MYYLIKRSTMAIAGLMAIALFTACSTSPETEKPDSQDLSSAKDKTLTDSDTEEPSLLQDNPVQNLTGPAELGAILRSQQAHRLINGQFATTLAALEIPLADDSFDFQFTNLSEQEHVVVATPKSKDLTAYAGGIHVRQEGSSAEDLILCSAVNTTAQIAPPQWTDGKWSCGEGTTVVE